MFLLLRLSRQRTPLWLQYIIASMLSTGVGAAPWIVEYGAGIVVENAEPSAWAAAILAALAAPPAPETRYAAQQRLMRELSPAVIAPQVMRCWVGTA